MMTTEEIPIYFRWIEYVGPFKPIFSEILVLQLAINGSQFQFVAGRFFFWKNPTIFMIYDIYVDGWEASQHFLVFSG